MANLELTEPQWLSERRSGGQLAAKGTELPNRRTPGWEFTDIAALNLLDYSPVTGGDIGALDRAELLFRAGGGTTRVSQVDAVLKSNSTAVFDGTQPIVCSLSEAVQKAPELVKRYLGTVVNGEDLFVSRNDANWHGGGFVYVPAGQKLEAPALFDLVAQQQAEVSWRMLVVLEEGAEAEVWEQYLSAGPNSESFVNTVVELVVAANAKLRFVSGQALSERTWLFGSQRGTVDRDGSLDWVTLGFGARGGKVRMTTNLNGDGSHAKVTGAYITTNKQHIDYDTLQVHSAPNTVSDLAFRGVLTDRSVAVWRGMIKVDPGAQKTDAFQENRNLLLSKKAHADAIPGLEIKANDVRCTHAAAIAQVNQEQLYYLQSRGLSADEAKSLVIEGFMQELVERFEDGPIKEAVSGALERRLEQALSSS